MATIIQIQFIIYKTKQSREHRTRERFFVPQDKKKKENETKARTTTTANNTKQVMTVI